MAQSPAHKLGQIIGDLVEAAVEPLLEEFAERHDLFLDTHGTRAARGGKKLTWVDDDGNRHDLDFVLERGGTRDAIGEPAAFIESAYRRYTKHSRNKAQEIQGAILPLKRTYWRSAPFTGVVLGGVFTKGAVTQLESLGFSVLYFHWTTIVAAFREVGVDIHFDEHTAHEALAAKVQACERLDDVGRSRIAKSLIQLNQDGVNDFMDELEVVVTRSVATVIIIPLHGEAIEWASVGDAIEFVMSYDGDGEHRPLKKIEVQVRYTNGDRIDAQFQERSSAANFLEAFR